jgi:uncharacterized protein (TIGR03067 family)
MAYRSLIVLAALGTLFVASTLGADGAKDAAKKLEGTWTVVSSRARMFAGHEVTFAGNKMTIKDSKGEEMKLLFKVDPSKDPPTIDMALQKGQKGNYAAMGIYELKGNTLRILLGPRGQRPTGFSCVKGTELTEMKRKKR